MRLFLKNVIDGVRPERDHVRITAHIKLDIAAILYHLNDVARKQSAFASCTLLLMQHCAAFEVPTAIDQRNVALFFSLE